jgi:ubiquitin-protein ligase E3 A
VWSKFGADWLQEKVRSLHQLITVRIVNNEGRWGRNYHINDDNDIASATKVMKILYYASIYGGG